jgi:hypothetical protein
VPTESGIILPGDPSPSGRAQRTVTHTTAFTTGAGGVVHQPVVSLGDPNTPGQLATVGAEGGLWVVPRGGARTNINWNAQAYSVPSAAALISLSRSTNAGSATAATTYTVTTGKTLRIQLITITGVLLGTTVAASRISLVAAASAVGTASPVMASFRLGNTSVGTQAANYGLQPIYAEFQDGLEFTSTQQIALVGVSSTAAMHALDISVVGYEY